MKKLVYHYGVWKILLIRTVIQTDQAPRAIGTYSQGIRTENLIYTSGQIPIDPESGEMIVNNFKSEVKQVLMNLDAVLKGGGSSLQSAVKLTVYLTDLSHFPDVNSVFDEFFPANPPARSALQVSALPMNVRIEIEAIGVVE